MSDLAQLLGNASSAQLLILLLISAGSAIFLTGYVVFFIVRRSKKGKMSQADDADSPSTQALADVDMSILSDIAPSFGSSDNQVRAENKMDLDLNLLRNGNEMEESSPVNEAWPFRKPEVAPNRQLEHQAAPTPEPPAEPVELLRLLRDPQSGQFMVQIGGQTYRKLADITDKAVGQFILKIAAHFLTFTNGMVVADTGIMSLHNPKVGQVPEPVAVPAQSIPTPADISAAPAQPDPIVPIPSSEAALLASMLAASPPQPEPVVPARGLLGRIKSSPTAAAVPSLNLAKEINEIVQTRLQYSPLGQTARVEILSAPDGGIKIHVNGQFYASPDEVPDPDVKNLIKESIKQWERI